MSTDHAATVAGITDRIAEMRADIIQMARDEGWTTLRLVRTLDAMQLPPLPKASA